jgi:hypothetical protein
MKNKNKTEDEGDAMWLFVPFVLFSAAFYLFLC